MYVASAEETEDDRLQYTAEFVKLMIEKSFLPGGRILANAGTNIKNLMNCFVLPIADSRQSIYDALAKSAEIFAWGGGVGYNFSNIRAKGSLVNTTGGKASGPLSFMGLFDTTGEVISQASRRGAQMGILNVDHPDIVDFIQFKNKLNGYNERVFRQLEEHFPEENIKGTLKKVLSDNQLIHFNISVGMLDGFMENVLNGERESLDVMQLIAENAWSNGDPGIYFIDRANEDNMVKYLGSLDATNPCGEVPLLPYEACCLGSINLKEFVDGKYIDYPYLKEVVTLAVRFLDNVQTLSYTPIKEVNDACRATRRLGLGVMGFADLLAEMDVRYDSEEAVEIAERLAHFIGIHAWKASEALGKEKGNFPAFDRKKADLKWLDRRYSNTYFANFRNVAVTSIAPTGTISLLADCNSGIEPFFSKKYVRHITEGKENKAVDSVTQEIKWANIKTANEIHWKDHVNIQAAWQKYVDNAVSKTINMPESATVEDIKEAYIYAWEKGCKGITVYRNNSKFFQILN